MKRSNPSAAYEATANLRSRPLLSVAVAGVALSCACATTVLSASELNGILDQQEALVDRGSYVFQVLDEERRPFSGNRCDAARSVEGVVAAGGMSSSSRVDLMFDGSTDYAVDLVTPGFVSIVWPEVPPSIGAASVAGASIAERFGLTDGSYLAVTDGAAVDEVIPVGHVATISKRDGRYDNRVAVVVPPAADVVVCLVEAEPGAQAGVGAVLESAFPAGEGFAVLPLMISDSVSRTPQEQLENRITRWTPFAAGLLAIALLVGSWLARSGEFGLYRFLGFSRAFVLRLMLIEALHLVWSPLAVGIFLGLAILPPGAGLTVEPLLLDLASLVLVTSAAIPIGVGLLATRSPSRMLKDVL